MTIRYSITLILFTFIFCLSCGGDSADPEPDKTPVPPGTTSSVDSTSGDDRDENSADSTEKAAAAEIITLEARWSEGDHSGELKQDLVIYHEIYVHSIVQARGVDPAVLNRVLYSQYVRILELDSGNVEAEAGLNGVRAWYETHGMTMPSVCNPIDFLPGHAPEEAPDEADE